jgi:ABC-type phosphonate transport system ATPase subunit
MKDTSDAKPPQVELANKDWVGKELMDTERRIEKAFHEQTQFLHGQMQLQNQKIDDFRKEFSSGINAQTRWMIGLITTMTIAILLAVLFKG